MFQVIDLDFLNTPQSIATFVLNSSVGPILFETGPHSTYENLCTQIRNLGYQPQDIKHVFLTHIHLDHAGAAWAFAEQGARVYVHPFGKRHLLDPSKLYESAKRIYQDQMDRLWGQLHPIAASQLQIIEHGATIELGEHHIRAWHTPGHAVHHIAWQVGQTLIAGDVAGVKIADGLVVPPCPPPDINIEDWIASIELIRQLDIQTIYLTHFGGVTNVQEHLTELESILKDWANWIYPYWKAGKSAEYVTPLFVKYTQNQLKEKGVDEIGLKQYEAANPSWMSVAGLMRYWRKKEQAINS